MRQVFRYASAFLAVTGAFALTACGGGGDDDPAPMPPGNRPPAFTSSTTANVAEGASGAIYTAAATDPDGNALTYSITGGADQALFRITSAGALSFIAPPDFEAPGDSDGNNVYQVQIGVSDGGANVPLSLAVTVTNAGPDGFRVRRVSAAFAEPVFLTPVPDNSGRVFVVQRRGLIRILTPASGAIAATPFLDVSAEVSTQGERGLLGLAIAPDFNSSGTFYIYMTNGSGTIELRRYRTLGGNRDQADASTGDVILSISHPRTNHIGGWLAFGPDGFLYAAVGDGGGGGDPDRNAQNASVLLGKIVRIDPATDAFPADQQRDYAIPAGNPFASAGGAPEVWALGLRNPFRNSFDSATGNLLIADVGQDAIEEVDLMRPGDGGANFGWSAVEGTQPYNGQASSAFTLPVAQYGHGNGDRQGSSITGGYVYRGPVESLRGQYIFADFVRPNIWSLPVSRFALGQTIASSEFTIRTAAFAPDAGTIDNIASFGVDQAGNLYIVGIDGEIYVVEPS